MEVSIAEEQTNVNSNDAVILDNKDLSTSIFQGAILASQLPYTHNRIIFPGKRSISALLVLSERH